MSPQKAEGATEMGSATVFQSTGYASPYEEVRDKVKGLVCNCFCCEQWTSADGSRFRAGRGALARSGRRAVGRRHHVLCLRDFGHYARHCPYLLPTSSSGKGKSTGKGADNSGFSGQRCSCGEHGHRQFQCPKWSKAVEVPSQDLEEEVQQSGSVWAVACLEEKAPVKVASRFAILVDEDEELEFEAPPGLEMRKAAALLFRKYSVCSVTQKTKKVKLEVTIDSGAMGSG